MAVEYRLTLAGQIPLEQVAECAVEDLAERPRPTDLPHVFGARLYDQRGFALIITSGTDGYYDAEDDDGSLWEWEPPAYADVTFAMSKDHLVDKATPNMLATVARVLQGRNEDAALVLNSDRLLLTRVDGVLRKHNRATWWDHYGFVNDIIPG